MKKEMNNECCSLEKGEIFPAKALESDSKINDLKAIRTKKVRSSYQELMTNYAQTR